MSHRWEHEDEYLQLRLALNRAKREGNTTLIDELQARIKIFDDMRRLDKTEHFPELAAFSSVVEALGPFD